MNSAHNNSPIVHDYRHATIHPTTIHHWVIVHTASIYNILS